MTPVYLVIGGRESDSSMHIAEVLTNPDAAYSLANSLQGILVVLPGDDTASSVEDKAVRAERHRIAQEREHDAQRRTPRPSTAFREAVHDAYATGPQEVINP